MRIKIFCEGQTEKGLRKLLQTAVNEKHKPCCGLRIKSYDGVQNLLNRIERKINAEFQNGASVVYLLVDLYHYPNIAPKTLDLRVSEVRQDIQNKLGHNSNLVKIFVIIHEVETWILADSNVIKQCLSSYNPEAYHNLEQDGRYEHPSEVLNKIFKKYHPKKYSYKKADDGVFLLERADWKKIYDTCTVFRNLVNDLRKDCQKFA